MSQHHNLDPFPVPKDVLYMNESGMADAGALELPNSESDQEQEDNVRIYVPLDLRQSTILRRLKLRPGEPTESNEKEYRAEIRKIAAQLEIYDRYIRQYVSNPEKPHHSAHAKKWYKKFWMC